MILPREVLKWFQRLDLTFSIRNPERDLSNGFVVGEILCRHFPNDIFVHSFDTGTSRSAREANWNMVYKFCLKHSVDIGDQRELKNILRQKAEPLFRLVVKLYAFCEHRPEPVLIKDKVTPMVALPSYAIPTASLRVKESSLDQTTDDILEQRFKRYLVIKKHEEKLHASRQKESPTLLMSHSYAVEMALLESNYPKSVDGRLIEEISAIQIKMIEVLRENYRLKSEIAQLKKVVSFEDQPRLGPMRPIPPLGRQAPPSFSTQRLQSSRFVSPIDPPQKYKYESGSKFTAWDPENLQGSMEAMQRLVESLDKKSHLHEGELELRQHQKPLSIEETPLASLSLTASVAYTNEFPKSSNSFQIQSKAVASPNQAPSPARHSVIESPAPPAMDLIVSPRKESESSSSQSPSESSSSSPSSTPEHDANATMYLSSKSGSLRINATGLPMSSSMDSLQTDSPLARLMKNSGNVTKIILPDDDEPLPTD